AGGARTVMVVLDSNHSTDHVLREMTAYHGMVTPGSYLVVMDGAAAHVWEVPRGQAQYRDDNPLEAIGLFLRDHPEFRPDPHYTRMHVTACPDGFLQRLGPGGPTDAPASE
ncbi:MAG: hypothetical protein HY722_11575, partial [Planctomycetes bacterium]|nr:hypothetical protein [Planctomycetota bacterium]